MGASRSGNTTDMSPLMMAIEHSQPKQLTMLLAAGADANYATTAGHTCLHVAADDGCFSVIAELVAAGADLELRTGDTGATPLIEACQPLHEEVGERQRLDTVRALLAAGASAAAADDDGFTALHFAAQCGFASLVPALVRAGADAEQRASSDNTTALMLAVAGEQEACVAALIKAGCDVNARSELGGETHTALTLGMELGLKSGGAILSALRRAGATLPPAEGF